MIALLAVFALPVCAGTPIQFNLPAGKLADALDRFGEQSGLQVVYDLAAIQNRQSPAVVGAMPAEQALALCLAGSGLSWDLVDEITVVLGYESALARRPEPGAAEPVRPKGKAATALGDLHVVEDPRRTLPVEPSMAAFGFNNSLLATPRSVSVISAETIDFLGLSAVEDLVRVAPGVFTTTRWGIQGSIDIRNVPADTYFRGMKRLNLQGHGRSVLAAMETIEIVKGPPSPIYGMGKIGGYTNMVPRSVRAATGGYLLEPTGFVQAIRGSYEQSEISFGVGGPLPLAARQGGYYIYGLLEDSDTFIEHVPIEQRVLQAAITIDNFAGGFRLETGINLQRSTTAGALMGRFTQDVADSGRYIRGEPLVDLDVNGNQRIGYREMYERSPVQGDPSAWNRALVQAWAWPLASDGEPLMLEDFPTVPGIPESLFNYLNEHPENDPNGLLRAQGIGGPLPLSGYVPAGFALDPAGVTFDTLDLHRAGAFERELRADFVIAYLDLLYDENPNFTIKNQLFFDSMNQYKLSEQPFSQTQDVYVLEDKLTLTRRLSDGSRRLNVNALASVNLRYTSSRGFIASGDYGTHRTDAMSGNGLPMSDATFATALLNERLDDDGMPWTGHYATDTWELGAGALFDIEIADRTSLIAGARIDRSRASNTDYAGTLDLGGGTASDPAKYLDADRHASGDDTGVSWSVSVSHELVSGVRPYLTVGRTSLALDGNNNRYSNSVIDAGHIGHARLAELGVKARLLGGKLFLSMAAYEQARLGVSADDDRSVITAHVSSTRTRGWEAEFKWVPSSKLLLSFYALRQETQFRPNIGATVMVDARALGFQDVTDAHGNVVYPAEAFLYGGRSFLVLPPDLDAYEVKQGNPATQLGITARYEFGTGIGFSMSGNYFSNVSAGRLRLVELPAAYVVNAGLFWGQGNVQVRYDVLNALDERYFRARSGDTLGDVLVSAMPGRHWQASIRVRF